MAGSSTSRSETSTNTSTQAIDRRIVADGGAVVIGDGSTGNTITATDHGAIDGAFKVAQAAGDIAKTAVLGATSVATSANEVAGRTTQSAFDFAGAAGRAALNADAVALTTVKEAYQASQESASGNRALALVGITIAGVLGVTLAMKRAN